MELVFDVETVYLCWTELFEIELFICIKIDLALNNLQWLKCHKIKPNQENKWLLWYRNNFLKSHDY